MCGERFSASTYSGLGKLTRRHAEQQHPLQFQLAMSAAVDDTLPENSPLHMFRFSP
jgi:hypothetical protein